jgi:threonine aldolase
MGNQLGLRLLVPPGQEVLADSNSHFLLYEDAGVAWQGGIQTRTAVTADGLLDPDTLAGMVHVSEPYSVSTRAIAVENTHNVGGGTVYPVERLRAIRAVADAAELKIHCDGARIWNAAVASGTSLREYGKYADTLSVGLSKGLGAPAGTVLLFDAEYADQARVFRHRMGGSMRQSGILAAACIYAFEHNVERMADDHANARLIAGILGEHGLDVSTPETNIVLVQVPDAAAVTEACQAAGVRVSRLNAKLIRLVTHLDVDARQCEQAAHTLG